MRAERKLHDASEDNPVRAVTASNYFKLACPARPPVVESRGVGRLEDFSCADAAHAGSGVAMGNHSRTSPGSASCEARSAIFPAGVRMIPDSNGTRASIDRDDYLSFACFFFPC